MGKLNPIVVCLGNYSATNIPMIIYDDVRDLSAVVWQIAGRNNIRTIVVDNLNLQMISGLAKNYSYNAILVRLVENFSNENQVRLVEMLVKFSPEEKGKFIFTTNDFEQLDTR